MPDWKNVAAERGITLNDAQASRLNDIDAAMRLMAAMIDWKEEPVLAFNPDLPEVPTPGGAE